MFKDKIKITKKIAVALVAILLPVFVFAQWDDCVHGKEGCEYPGNCGSYVDTNGDRFCDHSQPEPIFAQNTKQTTESDQEHDLVTGQDVKTMTVAEVADVYGIDEDEYVFALSDEYSKKIKPTDKFQLLHDNFGVQPSNAKNIAEKLVATVRAQEVQPVTKSLKTEKVENKTQIQRRRGYNLVMTTFVLLVAYFATWLLVKKGKMKQLTHRRSWNMLLLVTFLLSGISGILLVIRINYGIAFVFPFNLLKLHVETGITMAIITIFHIAWHWKYFKLIFKKK